MRTPHAKSWLRAWFLFDKAAYWLNIDKSADLKEYSIVKLQPFHLCSMPVEKVELLFT